MGNKKKNVHYEYGQALFATQNLQEAREQFKKSITLNYKVAASAYYVGYCSQILDDTKIAIDFYTRIQQLENDPENVRQPALYQIAEIAYSKNQEVPEKNRLQNLEKDVLPLYEKARDFASNTATSKQSETRISEIQSKLDANMPKMKNGVPIPKQLYTLKFTQDLEYNSNVTTKADSALLTQSHKDSLISKTSLLAKYQVNHKDVVSFIPELSSNITRHFRQDIPLVYQNDSIIIAPALRNKYEHTVSSKPATGMFDLELSYNLKDFRQQHRFPLYSKTYTFMIGEKAKYFNTGATTAKLSLKLFENYNPDRNSFTPSLSINQIVKMKEKYDWSHTLTVDVLKSRDSFNDERNYKYASSITFTDILKTVDFAPSFTYSLKDTIYQKPARGNEHMLNPAFDITKNFNKDCAGTFTYSFTKNLSADKQNYQYTQHSAKVSAFYSF